MPFDTDLDMDIHFQARGLLGSPPLCITLSPYLTLLSKSTPCVFIGVVERDLTFQQKGEGRRKAEEWDYLYLPSKASPNSLNPTREIIHQLLGNSGVLVYGLTDLFCARRVSLIALTVGVLIFFFFLLARFGCFIYRNPFSQRSTWPWQCGWIYLLSSTHIPPPFMNRNFTGRLVYLRQITPPLLVDKDQDDRSKE